MTSTPETAGFDVASIPLFDQAEPGAIREALSDCEVLRLPAGTPLLEPGQANSRVFIPVAGSVVVQLDTRGAPDSEVPIPLGECVGEMSAIDGKPVSALVITRSEARVLSIPQEVFWGRLMTLRGVAANVITLLSGRVRRSTVQALKAQGERLELEHLRKELDLARELQTSMLPLQNPMFPGRDDIEVCGLMEPASRVGGDFFDAFFVEDNVVFLCIGDVSGHGIASAMFMARTIGLLRILAMTQRQPDVLLTELNERLYANNETNLFVTLFCAFLDVNTGQMVYSNGGHCPPVVLSGAGVSHSLPLPKGPLIGVLPGLTFGPMECHLAVGDVLYCYTDGVTEAQDPQGEEFTDRRYMALLEREARSELTQVLERVRREVSAFTSTPFFEDDFTMLAVRRLAPRQAREVT